MTFHPTLDDDTLRESAEAVQSHGSLSKAAVALGITRSTLRNRLEHAARRGIHASIHGGPAAPGFLVDRTTSFVRVNPDGSASTLYQWRRDGAHQTTEDMVQALREVFAEYEGLGGVASSPQLAPEDSLTAYIIADPHVGMLAWGPESGEDYDINIATALLTSTMRAVVDQSPPSAVGVVLNLGDFFHADNDDQITRRSGNKLSVDGRHSKVLKVGLNLMIYCVDVARQKHERVIVRNLPGNHDPDASLALSLALWAFYKDDPRVEIDMDPSPFWKFEWGTTLLAAAHGDRVRPDDFAGMVAAKWPEEWGRTRYRYALFGHVHHRSLGGEKYGMSWESFRTLAAKDDFHSAHGYVSIRSMVSVTYDRERGEVGRVVRNIRPH